MYLNLASADDVECEVGFDHQNSIPVFPKLLVTRYPSEHWMSLKSTDAAIKLVDKRACSTRAVLSNEVKYRNQIVLRTWEVT
jgi:hypothetical protein